MSEKESTGTSLPGITASETLLLAAAFNSLRSPANIDWEKVREQLGSASASSCERRMGYLKRKLGDSFGGRPEEGEDGVKKVKTRVNSAKPKKVPTPRKGKTGKVTKETENQDRDGLNESAESDTKAEDIKAEEA